MTLVLSLQRNNDDGKIVGYRYCTPCGPKLRSMISHPKNGVLLLATEKAPEHASRNISSHASRVKRA
jgi:hypothetical protein